MSKKYLQKRIVLTKAMLKVNKTAIGVKKTLVEENKTVKGKEALLHAICQC